MPSWSLLLLNRLFFVRVLEGGAVRHIIGAMSHLVFANYICGMCFVAKFVALFCFHAHGCEFCGSTYVCVFAGGRWFILKLHCCFGSVSFRFANATSALYAVGFIFCSSICMF